MAKKKAIKRKASKKKPIKKPIKKKPVKRAAKKTKAGKPPARKPALKKSGKPAAKKAVKKPALKKPARPKRPKKGFLGEITHYFPKVRAAVITLAEPLSAGDKIKIKGHTTDFTQTVTSLQIDRVPIQSAKKGDEIGLQVDSRVRKGDTVTKQ